MAERAVTDPVTLARKLVADADRNKGRGLDKWDSIVLARALLERDEQRESENARLREALAQCGEMQKKALAVIERNGFVFEDIGSEPGNWQHLAFALYTDLCQVESIARDALKAES